MYSRINNIVIAQHLGLIGLVSCVQVLYTADKYYNRYNHASKCC